MTQISIRTPIGVAIPRGATVVAWLFRHGVRVSDSLARSRLVWSAERAALAATADANKLRAFAASMAHNEPGFAADLYAAADRHEAETP